MNGHAPGAEQLEQLRLRRRFQSATTSISSNSDSTTSTTTSSIEPSLPPPTSTSSSKSLLPKEISTKLFVLFLTFRSLNAIFLSGTFFQPDEYWQSLEVAHRFVFGYGYLTWEWKSDSVSVQNGSPSFSLENLSFNGPIRSFAFPSLFVPIYYLLKILKLDGTFWLTLSPRLLLATFAAIGDLFTFRLSQRILNEKAAYLTILISYFSLYGLYTSTRTFSNSLESVLTAIGLYYWPLSLPERYLPGADPLRSTNPIDQLSLRYALCAAAAACIIRPTNAVIWLYLAFDLTMKLAARVDTVSAAAEVCFQMITIIREGLWILVGALVLTLSLDSIFYSTPTFTPLSFLYNNVFKSISLFYGSHPFHWYLSQGIPVLTFTFFPFLLHGIYVSLKTSSLLGISMRTSRWFGDNGERDLESLNTLTKVTLFTILIFSLIGHKEFRFLQPLIPGFNVLITYSLMALFRSSNQREGRISGHVRNEAVKAEILREDSNTVMLGERISIHGRPPLIYPNLFLNIKETLGYINNISKYRNIIKGLLLIQVPFIIYLCRFHCKAQVEIMFEIRKLYDSKELKSVGFLMPCHSTPWQSHLHRDGLEIDGKDRNENGSGDDGLMWFITCEPPRDGQSLSEYQDQSDFFYQDPLQYLSSRFPKSVDPSFPPSPPTPSQTKSILKPASILRSKFDLGWSHTWPSHLVLFENLLERNENEVGRFLEGKGYVVKEKFWNSFKHEDWRRDGDVVVLEWKAGKRS